METYPNSRRIPYAPTEGDRTMAANTCRGGRAARRTRAEAEAETSRLREELECLKARLTDE